MFLQPNQALQPHHLFSKKDNSSTAREPSPLCLPKIQIPLLQRHRPLYATAGPSQVCSGMKLQLLRSWPSIQELLLPLKSAEQENTKQPGNLWKTFFSERLPISQLLPQEDTINSSAMRTLIYTRFSYSLCASCYHLLSPCPRPLTCMEQKTDPGRLFLISVPWLMQKIREIIVLAILLGKRFYELGLTKWLKIPNVQQL